MLTVNQANKIREISNNDDKLMECIMSFETLDPEQQDLILSSMRDLIRVRIEERKGA